MPPLNRLRTLGGLRGRALSGSSANAGDGLRADVVAYYTLSNVNDSGPNGYNLTNNNSVTFGAGKVGNAATFVAASSQSLSLAGAGLDITTTDYGFSLWVKTAVDGGMVIAKGANNSSGYYLYFSGSGHIRWEHSVGAGSFVDITTTGVDVSDDAWHHIVLNGDRDGSASIYIDGVSRGSGSIATLTATMASGSQFTVGTYSDAGGFYLDGSVDELGFWRRLLTADEIAYLYASGAGVSLYP